MQVEDETLKGDNQITATLPILSSSAHLSVTKMSVETYSALDESSLRALVSAGVGM